MCPKQFVYSNCQFHCSKRQWRGGGWKWRIRASCSATKVCCLVARTSGATCQASNSLRLNEILNNHNIIHILQYKCKTSCALRKILGSPMLWACEIRGAQHMILCKYEIFQLPKSKSKVPEDTGYCQSAAVKCPRYFTIISNNDDDEEEDTEKKSALT